MFVEFFKKYFPWLEKMKAYENVATDCSSIPVSIIPETSAKHESWKTSYEEADVSHDFFISQGLDMPCGIKVKNDCLVLPLYNIKNRIKCEAVISDKGVPSEAELQIGDHFLIGDAEPVFVVPDILSACILFQELGITSATYISKKNIPAMFKLFPKATFVTAGDGARIAIECGASVIDLSEKGQVVKLVERLERGDDLSKLLGVESTIVYKPLWIALKSFRPSEWLLKDYIAAGPSLCELFSPSGLGKTFLVIDLFLTMASGLLNWHGIECRKARCLYMCAEGYAAVIPRIQCWLEQHEIADVRDVELWIENGSVSIDDPNSVLMLQKTLDRRFGEKKPDIIAIDTMNLFMNGDENATQNATAFVKSLKAVSLQNNCTILLIHHTGIADESRSRGSSVFKGSLDTELRLSRSDQPEILLFVQTKNRMGSLMDEPIAFRLEEHKTSFEFGSGEKVSSCILRRVDEVPVSKKTTQETLDIELLIKAFTQTYSECPAPIVINKEQLKVFATEKWKDKGSAEISRQINPNQETRWLGRLIKAGIVESDRSGTSFKVVKESAVHSIRKAFSREEAPK